MPVPLTKLQLPQNHDYGWVWNFFKNNSVNPPPWLKYLATLKTDIDPKTLVAKGVSGVLVSPGTATSDLNPILDAANRWTLTHREFFLDIFGPLLFRDWQPDNAERAAQRWVDNHDIADVTGDEDEQYDGRAIRWETNAPMAKLYMQKIGAKLDARGQRYWGPYGGVILINSKMGNQKTWTALNGEAESFAFMCDGSSDGGARLDLYPYFKEGMYLYPGNHATVNQYARGFTNGHDRTYEREAAVAIVRMAMNYTKSGKMIMLYTEGVDNEDCNHTPGYRFSIPGKGSVYTYQWPGIDWGYVHHQDFSCGWRVNRFGDFINPQCFGEDRNVIMKRQTNGQGATTYRRDDENTGTIVNEQDAQALATRGRWPAPFPNQPLGFLSSKGVAMNEIRFCYDWVGGLEGYTYPTIEGNVPGPGDSFIKTMYDKRLPWMKIRLNENTGRGWVNWMYLGSKSIVSPNVKIGNIDLGNIRMLPGHCQTAYFQL